METERYRWHTSHGFLIVAVSERFADSIPEPGSAQPGKATMRALPWCRWIGRDSPGRRNSGDQNPSTRNRVAAGGRSAPITSRRGTAAGRARPSYSWRPGVSMNSVGHMARTLAERQIDEKPRGCRMPGRVSPREAGLLGSAERDEEQMIGAPARRRTWGWLGGAAFFRRTESHLLLTTASAVFWRSGSIQREPLPGIYHTDHTIPSPYFDEHLRHRDDLSVRDDLYFNYLHSLAEEDLFEYGARHGVAAGES